MTYSSTHIAPSVDSTEEDSVFLRGILRSLGHNKREITRLLEDVSAHAELIGLLEKVALRIETIGAERQIHPQDPISSLVVDSLRDEATLGGGEKSGTKNRVISEAPQDIDYLAIKVVLFSHRKDFSRFHAELMSISHRYPSLPQTLHAWVIWSGKWEELLRQISGYSEMYFDGDESRVYQIICSRVDTLRGDPDDLTKNPCTVMLSSGRMITLSSIYDFYARLGQGGVQVMDAIFYGMEKQIPKPPLPEPILKPRYKNPRRISDGHSHLTPVRSPSWIDEVRDHIGSGSSDGSRLESTHPKILSAIETINNSLRSSGSNFSCTSDDLVLTGFGMIILSATVSCEKKTAFRDFFSEKGRYKEDTIV